MIRLPIAIAMAATVSGLSFVSPAWADVTADEIGNRLVSLMANEGLTLSWDSIEGSGSDFTFKGAKVKPGESEAIVTVGDVQLRNVTELSGGDYRVGEMEFPSLTANRSGITVAMSGALSEGVLLADPDSTDPLAGKMIAERARFDEVTATMDGLELFRISNFNYQIERSNDGWDLSYTGAAERFSSDMSMFPDPQATAMLSALQLQKIDGSMQTAGTWSMRSGKADLNKFDVTFDNQGKLGLTASLGGYTQDFVKAMDDARKASLTGTPEQQQAQGLATLGLLQQLTISSASIRYDDASFARRAIDLFATAQNMRASSNSAADVAGTAQMLLPILLPQYLPPEVAQQVTTEVVKFLREPKNLEIRIAPAQPVPLLMLYGVTADPKAAVQALGLSMVANQ